jgi:ribosomal protein S12 methylthiotransferase
MIKALKIKFVNLGCGKNLVDSERLAGRLKEAGCRISANNDHSDICIINTCSFIEDARKEAVEAILAGIEWKSGNSGRRLFVFGCFPQRYPQELAAELPEVDGFFGVREEDKILEAILNGSRVLDKPSPFIRKRFTPKHYRYLRIADGCNNGCTFCSIPLIRGRYRSVPLEEVIGEAGMLVDEGARELVIIAQGITSYGSDLKWKVNLLSLLRALIKIQELKWIRLMYLHPPEVDEELIRFVVENEKVCPYFDFPIEHINDKILGLMGRRINRKEIINKLRLIRSILPGSAIRTSLMVGFPGEGEAEFRELLDFVGEGWFDRLGVFTYSAEVGTKAYNLPNTITPEEGEFRRDAIMELQREISLTKNSRKLNMILSVIIDERIGKDKYKGRTVFEAPEVDPIVRLSGPTRVGEITRCKISAFSDYDMVGEVI